MPRTSKARVFRSTQTSPNSGTVRDMTTAFGTAANTATTARWNVGESTVWKRWSPNTTNVNATPPAVGTAAAGMGWRDTVAEDAVNRVRYDAGTWTIRTRVSKTGQTVTGNITIRVTLIVYRVTSAGVHVAEIGRLTYPNQVMSTAVVTLTGSFTTPSPITFDPGDKIQVEGYVCGINTLGQEAAPGDCNINFIVDETSANSGAAFTAMPGYQILYARSDAVIAVGTSSMARKVTASRSDATTATGVAALTKRTARLPLAATAVGATIISKNVGLSPRSVSAVGVAAVQRRTSPGAKVVTAVGAAAFSRRVTAARSVAVTAVGVPVYGRVLFFARAVSVTATGVAAFARRVMSARTAAVTANGVAALARRVTAARTLSVVATGTAAASRAVTAARTAAVTAVGVPGYARALIFGRVVSVTAFVATKTRLDIPQEALNRIALAVTPDWPLNAPTKVIAGVTRDSAGAIVGSATVKLVRQSDDVRVATVTSHATTGAYSFTRGGDDPNAYYVIAYKEGSPEVHGISDRGLTPA